MKPKKLSTSELLADCFLVARRDLIGDSSVHKNFHAIRTGTQICLVRTGKSTFFCGFFDAKGNWVQLNDVPHIHYLKLLNRMFPLSGLPNRVLSAKLDTLDIKRFNCTKVAKLSAYTKRRTFPDTIGTVRTQDGKSYDDCVIVGDPEINTRGLLYLMVDSSYVFVPDIAY